MTRSHPLITIFVPTMTSRAAVFEVMMAELNRQMASLVDPSEVELLTELDDGELTIGAKRNRLLERATGDYVASVDDDDKIHPRYLELITDKLRAATLALAGTKTGVPGRARIQLRKMSWASTSWKGPPDAVSAISHFVVATPIA